MPPPLFPADPPLVIWLTGLSAAGKSTLAAALRAKLLERGFMCTILDGDEVRHGLSKDLGFSPEHRRENIRRVAEVASLMSQAGLIVIVALISPLRADREMAREIVGQAALFEVYVNASIEVCEARDPKQLYAHARNGQLAEFTGVSSPYEAPTSAQLVLQTGSASVEACTDQLLNAVMARLRNARGK